MDTGMHMFRSEDMSLSQLVIPLESVHGTVTNLAELGVLQFKDLNPERSPFQRTYANQVKRCDEIFRKLQYLAEQVAKAHIDSGISNSAMDSDLTLDELEGKVNELEPEFKEINANFEKLNRTYNELVEFLLILDHAGAFFDEARENATSQQRDVDTTNGDSIESPLLEREMQIEPTKNLKAGFIAGTIAKSKALQFERVIFRATRGNSFYKCTELDEPITDPATGTKIPKVVFVIFFSGERARTKITKIADAFGANRYPFPEETQKRRQMRLEISARLSELRNTLTASDEHRKLVLANIGYQLNQWTTLVLKEKAVYNTLNMLSLDVTSKCLVGEAWCPQASLPKIQAILEYSTQQSNSEVATIFQTKQARGESPPTYFRVNKFTAAFQEIVDAYGVARYKEVNPGVFTIVTFPFLFAVMFGDWGHGIVLLLATLWLVWNEKKFGSQKLGDIMDMAFGGRYVLLLMSLFSIYTGFIYNEFFSVPFEMFGKSAYKCTDSTCSDSTTVGLIKYREEPYPFGVDPVWHGSRSELPFLNSLKMKMSIILGVSQMIVGIFLSLCNGTYFRQPLDIWYQFLPQILFLSSLFGYLSFLIILKWCTGSEADLYHVMIYMFLSPTDDLDGNQLFPGQKYVQLLLLFIALVSVPCMLLPKPLILRKQHLEKLQGYNVLHGQSDEELSLPDEEHEEFEFTEIFVHQLIHTIEFVLGAVSNTASYLRLWALSLAHAELSAVFYEKVLLLAWGYQNPLIKLLGFLVFVFATVGVLLIMETLSAFLHALRLHWVEFQNKFYLGDGYKFHPFSFLNLGEDDQL